MLHQVIFGYIRCITFINPISKFGPILAQCTPFQATEGGQPHLKSKNKNKNLNVKLNILDEGYPRNNESIA
jgi:hypothetical protein